MEMFGRKFMPYEYIKSLLRTVAITVPVMLAGGIALAQTTANLTAARMSATLPDGAAVPMWGYCQTATSGDACPSTAWAPGPTIVVPTDSTGFGSLTINLSNSLPINTSIVILGQAGGGMGASLPREESPTGGTHARQGVTWPSTGTPCPANAATQDPPCTDPTFAPSGQQSRALAFGVEAPAGGNNAYSWTHLRPGTYLYETGSLPSLQAPMGLYGVLVVTQAPTATLAGDAYPNKTVVVNKVTTPGAAYDADVTVLLSEVDPRQNAAVDAAAAGKADPLKLFNDSSCTTSTPCYPPVVNYAPTYFLINGHAFNPTRPADSGFAFSGNAAVSGNVLVRLVNAGLRMHVPSIVGVKSVNVVAEDGNLAPGTPKKQSHILMAAGKTYDVTFKPTQTTAGLFDNVSLPIFDRALNLTSGNLDHQSVVANSGMLAFLAMQPAKATVGDTGSGGAAVPAALQAVVVPDVFATPVGTPVNGNVLTNDINVVTAAVTSTATKMGGVVTLATDGSFIYTPPPPDSSGNAFVGQDAFTYNGNGSAALSAVVTITVGTTALPIAVADTGAAAFTSNVASLYKSGAPGVLANDTASDGKTIVGLSAVLEANQDCASVDLQPDGSFTAVPSTAGTPCNFTYRAKNEMGAVSKVAAKATVNFAAGSGLAVTVQDTQDPLPTGAIGDYSWVIEEDTTFFHDPKTPGATNTLATNFHKSYMPVLATGCTGPYSCGDKNTVGGTAIAPRTRSLPADVVLDPNKRYFISILPGDADQGSAAYNADGSVAVTSFGHTMGGVPIAAGQQAATVLVARNPLPPSQLSVIVFEDNNPTNGGVDDNEQGLGGFTINLYDTRGSSGDPAGLMTYDLSAMPFTNSLANQTDSITHINLCPLTTPSGTIITCPELDSSGQPSPLAGMALIKNINPGRYDVWATPGADRAIKGEQWVQVSTLEGTHANDTFIKPGEPPYWQEFGPPGFHSFIGFINPAHIKAVTTAQHGTTTVTGRVPSLHMDRPRPTMANLNNSCATATNADGSPIDPTDASCRATLNSSPCYVAVNSSSGTGATVALSTCDKNGNFSIAGVPAGQHELVIWDQWLDQIIAYKALTVPTGASTVSAGDIPVFSWFTRVEQSAYQDLNGNGIRDSGEPGVSQIPMNVRFRDGSISNFLSTDSQGSVTANELFPLFNWYVLESDTTRYTGTGVMTAYDAGGKPDANTTSVDDLNGVHHNGVDYRGILNSKESYELPAALQVPNAQYTPGTTQRIDPGTTLTEGTQGYINQTAHVDWGKRPYVSGENGGITGMVYYASTRGFDDPSLEVQFSWEPGVAGVPVNLYQEFKNPDGSVTKILVDHTTTSSWDASTAQMYCPGEPDYDATQGTGDPFVNVTMAQAQVAKGQSAASAKTACYDGQHSFNQIQPAVYDGRYKFPTSNCAATVCVQNPAIATLKLTGKAAAGTSPTVLPNGNYIVELVVPPGYEIVKEEDKNILIGDTYIAPYAITQFMGVGNIFIVPDQATLNDANVPGGNLASAFPSCVGTPHLVPDYLTLFPDNAQDSPYAGQMRPLCDHKEVGVTDQGQGGADFQLFTQTPIAGHISGIMLNDAAAEFDPYNPAFLEKASLPNAPISVRDSNGVEIQRVYNDRYGTFNNLVPSTWEANIPNPSGYAPNMLTYCMNDPGPIADPSGALDPKTHKVRLIADPMYNPMFSNFCYNWPSMPGITTYLDTPVLPVSAYASASSYEPVDCAYPASTPAIYRVDGSNAFTGAPANVGPVVDLATGRTLTITALGDVQVPNPAYEGPNAVSITCPEGVTCSQPNQPKITRHYGFGDTAGTVQVGSLTLNVAASDWSDKTIVATVPDSFTGSLAGELVVTNSTRVKSIDTVTVTIGRNLKAAYVAPPVLGTSTATSLAHPIQDAIDAAKPGDLIIVDAGNYSEFVIMDRPVRLQGVGAAATVINATKYPNQKVDHWRTRINKLFGLDNQGNTLTGPAGTDPAVDPLPGQEITGGVVLLEPSVLSTEEGAGITVVAKGYRSDGTTPLGSGNVDCGNIHNFRCRTARIDGLAVTGGDAGGGIYVNGWAHGLEISNNRVYGNAGPFAGGVRIGQPYLEGQVLSNNFSGFKYDENILVHHNAITNNGTVEGNAAAGATAAAAGGAGGGLSICAGSDGYKVTGNWICGNYSSSDGGGIGHIGLSTKGLIQGNKILFNESYNQSGAQFGGGLVIEGEGGTGTTLTLGTGNVAVDQNLILGNFSRAGSGGGIRLQSVNGAELRIRQLDPWRVTVTNNMIVNNVAAWAGAGISLADTLYSNIVGNTIASNDSTGIAGNLFNTQMTTGNTGPTTAVPNPAGISSELTSQQLLEALPIDERAENRISNPRLVNDIVWRNRSFFFNMDGGAPTTHLPQLSPSNKWTDALAASKPALGTPGADGCTTADVYWDLGVVGDTSPTMPVSRPAIRPGNTLLSGKPNLVKSYCNASRAVPGLQFEPGTPFQPAFNISVAATLDESGNFVDLHFGPLSLQDQASGTVVNGDYHIAGQSGDAFDTGVAPNVGQYGAHDYDGDTRPQFSAYDKGADELRLPAPIVTLSATSLSFSTVQGTAAATQTITVTNVGDANLTGIAVSITGAFSQSNTCTDPIGFAPGSNTCTITVSFTGTPVSNNYNGTLAVTDNAVPSPQSVTLHGAVVARSVRGAFTPSPAAWTQGQTGALNDRVITLRANTANNAPLVIQSIPTVTSQGARFSITSTTCTANLALPAGNACTVTVRYVTRGTAAQRNAGASLNVQTNATNPVNATGLISDNLNGG
ncbi:MAG: multicopper oxidase type 3 [Gammaproteobacteria bacterium]|nr:multicopper oxidase type 3 [Gammaproteobacteria bacterium]